jgi:ribosomal protein S18 acetylase RimI-like enzyme
LPSGSASNTAAQRFYRSLGFKECGRLTRQAIIDGIEDDFVNLKQEPCTWILP